MSEQRFVFVTYCDDVRQEIGNKLSLIGCYQSEMLLNTIPASIPKLCAVVHVATPFGHPFKKLDVKLTINGETLSGVEFGPNVLKAANEAATIAGTQDNMGVPFFRMQMTAILVVSPLIIVEPVLLRVFASTEEGELSGPSLRIKGLNQQMPPPPVTANGSGLSKVKRNYVRPATTRRKPRI
jgi:hypothetical protein